MIQHVSLSDTTCDVFDAPSAVTCRQWRALSSVCPPFQPWLPYRPGVRWHATIPFNPRWFAIISVMEITVKKTYHLSSTISAWLCINHIITLSSNNIKHLTNKDHTIMQLSCTFMNHSQSYHDMPQSLIINDSLCTEKRPFPTWPIGRPSWQETSSCHLVRTVGVKETANHPSNQHIDTATNVGVGGLLFSWGSLFSSSMLVGGTVCIIYIYSYNYSYLFGQYIDKYINNKHIYIYKYIKQQLIIIFKNNK